MAKYSFRRAIERAAARFRATPDCAAAPVRGRIAPVGRGIAPVGSQIAALGGRIAAIGPAIGPVRGDFGSIRGVGLNSRARPVDARVMTVIPDNPADQIGFCELHLPPWQEHAAALQVPEPLLDTLAVETAAARSAHEAALAAREAALAATRAFRAATARMRTTAAACVRVIKTTAAVSGDGSIYTLAQIDPPASPSRTPRPARPEIAGFVLNPVGSLTLRWRSADTAPSSGVLFSVERRLEGEANFRAVGGVMGGSFTDDSIPSGTLGAVYFITARRGAGRGLQTSEPSAAVSVRFGVPAADGTVKQTPARRAA